MGKRSSDIKLGKIYIIENDVNDKYVGKVKIETIDIDTSPKEVVKISVKFKGNGELTFPTEA